MKQDYAHYSVKMLRYTPAVSFLLMFSHVTLLMLGIDLPIAEILVTIGGYAIIYLFSKAFGFCLFHRLLIYYAFTMFSCIWLRRVPDGEYGLFCEYIHIARGVMFVLGCILLTLLIIRACKK